MLHLELPYRDPRLNLALEETLCSQLSPGAEGYFLLWQNDPSIIIGRHQAIAEVVNMGAAFQEKIPIIRRISGGGAVYHDEGNLNFSFIVNAGREKSFADFLTPVCQALDELGIKTSISGRNDLEVDGKKISGSSQFRHGSKLIHHGTLLFNLDIKKMTTFLRVDPGKLSSHGVPSIQGRIANLREISQGRLGIASLKEALMRCCANGQASLPAAILEEGKKLAKEKYGNPLWNYGASPRFDLERRKRFPWGEIIVRLALKENRIDSCEIRGDFFNSKPLAELEEKLSGLPFTPNAMLNAAANLEMENYFLGCDPLMMREFFTKTLFT